MNWLGYHWELGNVVKAGLVLDELRTIAHDGHVPPIRSMIAAFGVAWNEALSALPSYQLTVAHTLELAHKSGFEFIKYGILMAGLIGSLSDGDLATAGPWLEEIAKNIDVAPPQHSFVSHWMLVWGALITDDVAAATRGQPEMLQAGLRDGWPLNNIVACRLSAQVLHQGHQQQAQTHLDHALEIARVTRSPYFEFMARLTEAQVCFDSGQHSEGIRASDCNGARQDRRLC